MSALAEKILARTAKTSDRPTHVAVIPRVVSNPEIVIDPVTSPEGRTEVANARRFAVRFGHRARFCHPWGKWLVYDGRRWKPDDAGATMAMAKELSDTLWQDARRANDEHAFRFAARSAAANSIKSMLSLATSEPGIPVQPAALDADPWVLNCGNGTVDLRSGELRPHSPDDMLTKLCQTPFDSSARCKTWESFLASLFDDAAVGAFLARYLGYCATGSVQEQVLGILHGCGANGKSTLLNAAMETLGPDYSMQGRPELLMSRSGEPHPTETADLHGRRLVSCVETDDGRRLAEGTVKALTGGERVRARRLYEDFWEFTPTHKLVLATNHKPEVRGNDHAIWRRLVLIPFTRTFWNPVKGETGPDELKQDKSLPAKLRAEAPGILAWLVRGCLEWQRDGLAIPETVRASTNEFRTEQDVIEAFIAERCITGLGCYVGKASDLYAAYSDWCDASGEHAMSQRKFGQRLSIKGFERFTSNGTWYRMITIRDGGNGTNGTTF